MTARRLFWAYVVAAACAAALAASPRAAHAQNPPRVQLPAIPGMSGAPPEIQAIWKKVASGGVPTQQEAAKLSAWMAANKDNIVKAATAKSDSVQKAVGGPAIGVPASAQHDCPRKVALPASLALTPTPAGAAKLLDSLKAAYTAKLTPDGAKLVQKVLSKATDAAQLNVAGGTLLMKGYAATAIVVYIGEISRAKGTGIAAAWADLGAALISAHDWLHAVPVVRQAIFLGGRTAPFVSDLGVAYADLGDLNTAQTVLAEATRTDPRWSQAWDALGRVESCEGNKIPAARALGRAQDGDWDSNRQDAIDKLNTDPSSDDDATQAALPLPTPPGPSPFPPPPGGGSPGHFAAYTPKLGQTWQEQRDVQAYDARMQVAYMELARQILAERSPQSVTQGPGGLEAGAMDVVVILDNDRQASAGAQLVRHRAGARMNMMMAAWVHSDSLALGTAAARAGPVSMKKQQCDASVRAPDEPTKCLKPYCDAMTSIVGEAFAARRGAAATFVGGVEGLSGKFSQAMNAWFDYAGEPATRRDIDRQRRAELASMLEMAYGPASAAQAAPPEECIDLPAVLERQAKAKAEAEAKRDEGECTKVSIDIPMFAKMEADCHEMKMSAEILSDYIGGAGTPTLEITRASGDKNGKFFIGVTRDASGGSALGGWSASAGAGLQVTWDNQGWVQSSGGVVRGEAGAEAGVSGVADASAHASGDLLVSARNTGPAVSGSGTMGGSVDSPGVSFAPSVSFGG